MLADENRNDDRAFIKAILASEAEYVAMLDGDDYWTSRRNLQKQVDFLEHHTECSICFHDVAVIYEDGRASGSYNDAKPDPRSVLEDLVLRNFIPPCGAMFRRQALGEIPEWFFGTEQADWLLNMLCARNGDIGYIDEKLGAYRIHGGGSWSSVNPERYRWATIRMMEKFNVYTSFKHDQAIRIVLFKCYGYLTLFYFSKRDLKRAQECLEKSLRVRPAMSLRVIREVHRGIKRELRSSTYH